MAQGLDFGDYAIEMGDVPTSLRKMQEMLNVFESTGGTISKKADLQEAVLAIEALRWF